ncbi:MAG: hypothetical protein LBN12_05675 [Clostridiales Family XIII bacterium]|jgi:hypothetical protein|nr:hypothetical protein [Clostridiales Family XIII bacterium]
MDQYLISENEWLYGITDPDDIVILPAGEQTAYELVHALLNDVVRLTELVMETRCAMNWRTPGGPVFEDVSKGVMKEDYIYLPAMNRYVELYKDEAVKLWDGAIDWEAYE